MTGLLDQHEIYYNYDSSSVLDSNSLGELFTTLRTLRTIIWTTVTIMPLTLDPKVVPAINGTSPPLPFVFLPQGNHSVSLQYSTSWAVDTIVGSTIPIMSRRLDTNVPEKGNKEKISWDFFTSTRSEGVKFLSPRILKIIFPNTCMLL